MKICNTQLSMGSLILSEKFSNRIFKTIDDLCSNVISTEKLEKVVECVSLSADKVNKNLAHLYLPQTLMLHKLGIIKLYGIILLLGNSIAR